MVIQNHTCRLNFHLNVMARATVAVDIMDGRARANLLKYTNKRPNERLPAMTHRTPRQGQRIFLSSAVITLSSGNLAAPIQC